MGQQAGGRSHRAPGFLLVTRCRGVPALLCVALVTRPAVSKGSSGSWLTVTRAWCHGVPAALVAVWCCCRTAPLGKATQVITV